LRDDVTVFSPAQRDALRDQVLVLARADDRVVAGAAVGSLALAGGGDRSSDLDLTFALADGVAVGEVVDDWTRTLGGVPLIDLVAGPTTYRVLLFADALQLDLSFTPAAHFAPAGPKFRLLFGEAGPERRARPVDGADLLGWGVVLGLHARTCIDRSRLLAAEHYLGEVRFRALSLACLARGLPAVQARGHDDLPPDVRARFASTRATALEPEALRQALAHAMAALFTEAREAGLEGVARIQDAVGDRTA
jgi:hypothetical protein